MGCESIVKLLLTFWKVNYGKGGVKTVGDPESGSRSTEKAKPCKQKQKKQQQQRKKHKQQSSKSIKAAAKEQEAGATKATP